MELSNLQHPTEEELRELNNREVAVEAGWRLCMVPVGAVMAQYAPHAAVRLAGLFLLVFGLLTAGPYAGTSLARLMDWVATRRYESK